MKKWIIISTMIAVAGMAQAQQSGKVVAELIGTEASGINLSSGYELIDDQARIVGSYSVVPKGPGKGQFDYSISYNEKVIRVSALTALAIVPDANRIITWGTPLSHHFAYTFSYKIYDLDGHLIQSVTDAAAAPFEATVSKEGELIYAARQISDLNDTLLYLKKVGTNGEELWTRKLGNWFPQRIECSAYDGSIALLQWNRQTDIADIRLFNQRGRERGVVDYATVTGMDFLGENRLAVSGPDKWFIVDLSEKAPREIVSGKINGNTASLHPFYMVTDKVLAVSHLLSEQTLTGMQVDLVDIETGANLVQIDVSKVKIGIKHHRILTGNSDQLRIWFDDEWMVYKLTGIK